MGFFRKLLRALYYIAVVLSTLAAVVFLSLWFRYGHIDYAELGGTHNGSLASFSFWHLSAYPGVLVADYEHIDVVDVPRAARWVKAVLSVPHWKIHWSFEKETNQDPFAFHWSEPLLPGMTGFKMNYPDSTIQWHAFAFGQQRPQLVWGGELRTSHTAVMFPLWAMNILTLFLPAIWIMSRFDRSRRRARRGLCAKCGYDLRAHAPGSNCPECGTAVAPASPPQ